MNQDQCRSTSDDRPFYGTDKALLAQLMTCERHSCSLLQSLRDCEQDAKLIYAELGRRKQLLEFFIPKEKLAQK